MCRAPEREWQEIGLGPGSEKVSGLARPEESHILTGLSSHPQHWESLALAGDEERQAEPQPGSQPSLLASVTYPIKWE